MKHQPQFTFISGPSLRSVGNRDDISRLRSQLIKQGLRKEREIKSQNGDRKIGKLQLSSKSCTCSAENVLIIGYGRKLLPAGQIAADEVCLRCRGIITNPRRPHQQERDTSPSNDSTSPTDDKTDLLAMGCPLVTDESRGQNLIFYCMNILWPGFRSSEDYPGLIYNSWMPQAESNPHVYHALLCCASHHSTTAGGCMVNMEAEQLRHRVKTIQSIREIVSNPGDDYNVEALLLAILIMAMNNDLALSTKIALNPFKPPLKEVQWLAHYSQRPLHPSHWSAIQNLVETHGGPENLSTFGLPWLLSYASLIQAAISFSKPVYPLLRPTGVPFNYIAFTRLSRKVGLGNLSTKNGIGFEYLRYVGIQREHVQVFIDLADLSQIIQYCFENSCGSLIIDQIADARNIVQHRILSLPTIFELEKSSMKKSLPALKSFHLYEICRLVGLLYSTSVTFPISCTVNEQEKLLLALQHEISLIDQPGDGDTDLLDLLIWATMIGGMHAVNSPNRLWHAAQFSKLSIERGLRTWPDVRDLMNRYLWMEAACDTAGRTFWKFHNLGHRIMNA